MSKKNRIGNIILGLILIAVAAMIVLWKLEVVEFTLLAGLSIWQIVLGALFLFGLFHSLFIHRSASGAIFSVAFLAIVFGKELHIEALVPWTILLCAALLSIGIHLIFGKNKHAYPTNFGHNGRDMHGNPVTVETVEGDVISETVSFTGVTKYIHADNFTRADLSCSFCGAEFYFDNVNIPSGRAEIVINSSFCGVSLFVPRNWTVVDEMNSFLGGVDIDNRNITEPIATIVLRGSNSFAGVEVKRV